MDQLSFSLPFLCISHATQESLSLYAPTILVNVGTKGVRVGKEVLAPMKSCIAESVEIDAAESVVLMSAPEGYGVQQMHPHREDMMQTWTHVHSIFPLPHLVHTNLWRSEKQVVDGKSFNFWFAAAGTDCGLHNKHDFQEVHTQIFGRGHMQKFHENDESTLYEDVPMEPGYTHEPFFTSQGQYPWHRYLADTDCVWLAVEY